MKKVVLAFSGGLDTSYCAIYLAKNLGYEVHSVAVNTGGFDAEEVDDLAAKAVELGIQQPLFGCGAKILRSRYTLFALWECVKKSCLPLKC